MATLDYPKIRRAGRWFDVRHRKTGMWAYALNRVTGIVLVGYLYLHLLVLTMLVGGAGGWNSFVSVARSRVFLGLDVFLLACILVHGLNGLRLVLTGLGVGVGAQKRFFLAQMCVAALVLGAATVKIYGG